MESEQEPDQLRERELEFKLIGMALHKSWAFARAATDHLGVSLNEVGGNAMDSQLW